MGRGSRREGRVNDLGFDPAAAPDPARPYSYSENHFSVALGFSLSGGLTNHRA